MSRPEETAYPRLKTEFSPQELGAIYTPGPQEKVLIFGWYRQAPTRVCLLIQLKLLQRLGYFLPLAATPPAILEHICRLAGLRVPAKVALQRYDQSGSKPRHQQRLRVHLGIQVLDAEGDQWQDEVAHQAATSKQELPDIINILIEELVRRRYELPGFTRLSRLAQQARASVNESIYQSVANALPASATARLDQLLEPQGRSAWDGLKREPKRPGAREVASFLKHINGLIELADGLPLLTNIAISKRTQMVLEARALDIAEMRAMKANKRYTLAVLMVQSQLQKAMDDVAEIFIKTLRSLHRIAEERLQQYHLTHVQQVDRLIGQFREVLTVLQAPLPSDERLAQVDETLEGDPASWIVQCDEHMAFAGNNYYPFMLQPYRSKRSLLFQCLDVLALKSSSQDDALLQAVDWLQRHRNSHREYLTLGADEFAEMALEGLPEKWRKLIFAKGDTASSETLIHRKYFELCIFSQVMQELKSGDLYVEHSDQYDDYREHLVSWDEYQEEVLRYGELVGMDVNPAAFTQGLRNQLSALAQTVDDHFPDNEHVDLTESGLLIRRTERREPPPQLPIIDQAITATAEPKSILDVLTETERWLDLHRLFGPLSGFEAKLDEPRKRFITTLFCYGCNLGASQTARSVKGFSRKQVAWLNLKHVTEERLDKAIVAAINAYNRFALPRYWGSGKAASADGTKWNVYEQNLLSEYHIRYGGYGGIGYYHVSDMYIALFSRFIPCGVYEAVYILDGLVKNDSDIQPDTVHGDTQAQNAPVFGLAHLLGIQLMPRIRNIKELVFFKPEKGSHYRHINSLFRASIDWALIERHVPDMLRVAISIKAGKITPSMILRRLGTYSRKNKLYFAFRELGRVVRTMFLLNYINDIELRRNIHAATNKSEEFNNFTKWLFFGGEGIIAENVRHEQRKVIKYNHLVANLVILHNVQEMSRVLKDLQRQGHPVDEAVLKALSPHRTSHINRFGDYTLDLDRKIKPIDYKIQF